VIVPQVRYNLMSLYCELRHDFVLQIPNFFTWFPVLPKSFWDRSATNDARW